MRYFFLFLSAIILSGSSPRTKTIPEKPTFVVLQLFTSQGCSSCPPADILAEKIKKEYADKGVIILSYHVDYWDRLGWKDPFGKRAYSEIQYAYANKFRERRVYTPQIVINGKEHFNGADEYLLRKKLKSYLKKTPENPIKISTAKKDGDTLLVNYNIAGETLSKRITFALVLDKETTKVHRGENAHRTLTNSNIVIMQKEVTLKRSAQGEVSISISEPDKKWRLIAFVQDKELNITGATQVKV